MSLCCYFSSHPVPCSGFFLLKVLHDLAQLHTFLKASAMGFRQCQVSVRSGGPVTEFGGACLTFKS